MNWFVAVATFAAAAVPWVEALTIVLAVGLFSGWRSAFLGMAMAAASLVALVAIFGLTLATVLPVTTMRLVVGIALLLFGLQWLQKAILRSGRVRSMHNEADAFAAAQARLAAEGAVAVGSGIAWDGVATSFSGVFLEGLEVIFIVLALGGINGVPGAVAGALLSAVAVSGVGVAVRQPLTRVPENAIKYIVGIMLTTFGSFYAAEGLGATWWRDDISLIPLLVLYSLLSVVVVWFLRREPDSHDTRAGRVRAVITRSLTKTWGLFMGDRDMAFVALIGVLAAGLAVDRLASSQRTAAAPILVAGVVVAVIAGVIGPAKTRKKRAAKPAVAPAAEAVRAPRVDGSLVESSRG